MVKVLVYLIHNHKVQGVTIASLGIKFSHSHWRTGNNVYITDQFSVPNIADLNQDLDLGEK
jgi:hypothetical protein